LLGASESANGTPQLSPQLCEIVGGAICQGLVGAGPDVLGGIEFRSIGREAVHSYPGVSGEEGRDFATAVNAAAIPQEVHGAAQMAEQMLEERADIEPREVAGLPAEVEGHAAPPGRDAQPGTDRQAVAAVAVAQIRGLALGGPGPTDVGDEQEPAFVDEDQMGATSSGVFLSGASLPASTARWQPRPAPRPAARASGNSSPDR
jgi:hypothetical protein